MASTVRFLTFKGVLRQADRFFLDAELGVNSYHMPSGTQGLCAADSILDICPTAKLYIARLNVHGEDRGASTKFTAQSVAMVRL